jgi:hypothetical protein
MIILNSNMSRVKNITIVIIFVSVDLVKIILSESFLQFMLILLHLV